MKVISCNIGQITMIKWRGKDIKTGINKQPVNHGILLESTDVKDDHVIDRKYHGGIDQACYIYGKSQYDYWQQMYPDLDWHYGFLGENITVEDLDESSLISGQIYQLGTAKVQITKPRQPCYKLGVMLGSQSAVKTFWDAPYPGTYLKIIEQGTVQVGDQMTLIKDSVGPTILDMYIGKRKKETHK